MHMLSIGTFIHVFRIAVIVVGDQHCDHAHVVRHFEIVGDVFEEGGAGWFDGVVAQEDVVGCAGGLRDIVGVDDVEDAVKE